MLLEWYQCHFRPAAVAPLKVGLLPKMRGEAVEEEALKFVEIPWKMVHDKLEELLGKAGPFLTGDHMTLADILVFNEVIAS